MARGWPCQRLCHGCLNPDARAVTGHNRQLQAPVIRRPHSQIQSPVIDIPATNHAINVHQRIKPDQVAMKGRQPLDPHTAIAMHSGARAPRRWRTRNSHGAQLASMPSQLSLVCSRTVPHTKIDKGSHPLTARPLRRLATQGRMCRPRALENIRRSPQVYLVRITCCR
jgi:hypothetical protein